MKRNAVWRVAIAWLTGAIVIASVGRYVSAYALDVELRRFFSSYFLITLDEPMFSDATGTVNDRESIVNVGMKINDAIGTMIERPWFAAARSCRAAVRRIDGVPVDTGLRSQRELVFEVPRNRIVRPVNVGVACEYRLWPDLVWTAALGIVFFLLYTRTAQPLSGGRLRWMNELVARGYEKREAHELCASAEAGSWSSLNGLQLRCVEALHNPAERNFADAMRVASDPRVADMSQRQIEWLVWWVQRNRGDLDAGVAIARAPDIVEIDLTRATLRIHGVDIPVNRTPLFYYAWYAHNRRLGDGWLTNPQSNKPDKCAGAKLAQLMWTCAGHAKAAAGVEEAGLKAKTLDQNRSKIKQEIVAVLGEHLGAPYLFDERKDPQTGRMSYRLGVAPDELRIRS